MASAKCAGGTHHTWAYYILLMGDGIPGLVRVDWIPSWVGHIQALSTGSAL